MRHVTNARTVRRVLILLSLATASAMGIGLFVPPDITFHGGSRRNMGRIRDGTTIEAAFVVENSGLFPAEVSVDPVQGCDCLTATIQSSFLIPRATSRVVLRVDVTGLGNQTRGVAVEMRAGLRAERRTLFMDYEAVKQ